MDDTRDWLSRLLEMIPVRGTLDYRCFLGAPWRIDFATSELGEIPYHVILGGSAVLEDSESGPTRKLIAGDILLFPHGAAHALHDGSDAPPVPARQRSTLATVFHENDGTGDRLDMMCGRFILSTAHDRLMRSYLPRRLILHAPENSAVAGAPGTGAQVVGLVGLMRAESATENLGGLAMLNALSTALFAVALRLASETASPADGLLALAGNPRLAPALTALFNEPARAWTLPELARRCNMSRATFIRHFQERLGRSASDLLTDIRMTPTRSRDRNCRPAPSRSSLATNRRPPSSARSSTRWGSPQPSGAEWAHAPLSSRSRFMTTHRLVADPRRMAAERLLVWRECRDRPGRGGRWRRGRW